MDVTEKLHRIQNSEGNWVLAWGCSCGEDPTTPMAVVKYDDPIQGVEYGFYHVNCIEKVEDDE
jgi:hypothetical protein